MLKLVWIIACTITATPVFAQVINGEGTYEGSSMHQPPAPDSDETSKTRHDDVEEAGATSRNQPARHD